MRYVASRLEGFDNDGPTVGTCATPQGESGRRVRDVKVISGVKGHPFRAGNQEPEVPRR
jgi:hypothetical protein